MSSGNPQTGHKVDKQDKSRRHDDSLQMGHMRHGVMQYASQRAQTTHAGPGPPIRHKPDMKRGHKGAKR